MSTFPASQTQSPPDPPGTGGRLSRYVPTVGPLARILLLVLFVGVALLGSTGAYLAAITFLNWWDSSRLYTTPFTFWMLLVHCVLGVFGVLPFLVFGAVHYVSARRRSN